MRFLEVTHLVEGDFLDIYQCNNCGAHADRAADIKHYPTCKPGESKKWEKFYDETNM